MIVLGVSHQTLHKVLGHFIICDVAKFQNCRSDDKIFIDKKHEENISLKTTSCYPFLKNGYLDLYFTLQHSMHTEYYTVAWGVSKKC